MERISFQDTILPNNIEPIVDVTDSLSIADVIFWRQIGHYPKGENSKDPIERYREFYQVIEGENNFTITERAVRHAVNHPMLVSNSTLAEVTRVLGSSYFDPMNETHVDIVSKYVLIFKKKLRAYFSEKYSLAFFLKRNWEMGLYLDSVQGSNLSGSH